MGGIVYARDRENEMQMNMYYTQPRRHGIVNEKWERAAIASHPAVGKSLKGEES